MCNRRLPQLWVREIQCSVGNCCTLLVSFFSSVSFIQFVGASSLSFCAFTFFICGICFNLCEFLSIICRFLACFGGDFLGFCFSFVGFCRFALGFRFALK
ncbi:MAG: hypothetical protein V3V10_02650 [Planctomycetota bacterium]